MKKYLPIKFYQKREERDDRLTLGMGSNDLPKWVLTGEELAERVGSLVDGIQSVVAIFESRTAEYDYIPAVVSVELDDNAIAKSHRSSIKEIFDYDRESKIVGFNNDNELLVRIDSPKDAKRVQTKIQNSQKYSKGISSITEITPYLPHSVEFKEEDDIFKASLFNYYDYSLNESVKSAFIGLCQNQGVTIKESIYSDDLIIFRLEHIKSLDQYEKVLNFPAMQFLEPMPMIRIGVDAYAKTTQVELEKPEIGKEYPKVGILDSGIANVSYLEPWIIGRETSYPDEVLDRTHGTFVAGVVSYGDALENREITGTTGIKLFDAAVMPDTQKEEVAEDELIENIREIVSKHNEIKIWNLSLGYVDKEVDECNFSQFAMALDEMQQKYDIIFCKSAGNCSNFVNHKPVGRITIPSDSVLSLVVGSVGNEGSPSVFSRTGHGPAHINKPDLVSYGGNYVRHGSKLLEDGVKSFDQSGNIYESTGTSFSAPRVSALLAGLDFSISDPFDPLLIKALAVHSAKYPEDIRLDQSDRVKFMGYGIPDNINNILYNSDSEITLIQSDRLIKGKYMEILEFPYPESLIDENGYFYGDVTITLVTAPVLFPGNGAEYCQSNIDVKFGTFDEIEEKVINRVNKNEVGPDHLENLLLPEKYRTRYIKNSDIDNPFIRERTLLNYGQKYQPIKKWHINLHELTPAKKEQHLKAPKKWGLRLSGLYRDFAETRAGLERRSLYQDFCLIITIKDPNNEKLVYNEVAQLLENRNFIHSDIQIRDVIQTQIRV